MPKRLVFVLLFILILPPLTALLQDNPNTADVRELFCRETAHGIEGEPGTTIRVLCPMGCGRENSVWGTDLYTDDSVICYAAQHAGIITWEGGIFDLTIRDGQDSYKGSTRYEITSSNFDAWPRSFSVSNGMPLPSPSISCLSTGVGFLGEIGETYSIECPAACGLGLVWGTDVYTDDSALCTAAAHAGVLDLKAGGMVDFTLAEGQISYVGVLRNNIGTFSFGEWGRSYYFPAQEQPTLQLTCESSGAAIQGETGTLAVVQCPANCGGYNVWGTEVYTGDSSICAAGIHAGIIPSEGGRLTVRIEDGQASYPGSNRNGVESMGWDEYPRSFSVADQSVGDAAWLASRAELTGSPETDEPDAEATPE